jgi:GTP pyrophosphokinase
LVTIAVRLPEARLLNAGSLGCWLDQLEQERQGLPLPLLRKACDLAQHVSCELLHSALSVVDILHDLEMDDETLTAALLHITDLGKGHLSHYPAIIQQMLADLLKMDSVTELRTSTLSKSEKKTSNESLAAHTENLRRMLLSIAEDVRVVVIILAERLFLMRSLKQAPDAERRILAQETRDLHAPLANRLGIWRIKWELEDFCLRYLEPDEYNRIAKSLAGSRVEREGYVQRVIELLSEKCQEAKIRADIAGRPKHIFSIWKKMARKGVDIDRIFDLLAVRIIVESVAECYAVLGFVHGLWRHIPGEFDDYIATPKANLYRSLHTAVVGPEDKPLEVQIRTWEMHEHSERGIAAHWAYKESRGHDAEFQRRLLWMRQWLQLKEETNDQSFIEEFKTEYAPELIYVLSPMGKVIELPRDATPLDFAYAIHSGLGHRCRGAKVDGRIVPLTYSLHNGESVEVLTTKEGGPSRDWLSNHLGYLKTSRARNRVRQWFRQQDYDQHLAIGRASLDKEIERLGLQRLDLNEAATRFNFKKAEDLLAAIGCGELSPVQVVNDFNRHTKPQDKIEALIPSKIPSKTPGKTGQKRSPKGNGAVLLDGIQDLMHSLAGCCKPVPHDPIIGFITRGRGVSVHRADCGFITRLPETETKRLISADWSDQPRLSLYSVDILVEAGDRRGLLRDISAVLSNEEVDVLAVSSQSDRSKDIASFRFTVEVGNMQQLSRVIDKIAQLPEVFSARRRA